MKLVQFMIGHAGGAETFFVKLAAALAEIGIEQHLIVNEGGPLATDAAATGIATTLLPVSKWLDIPGRLKLRRTLREQAPDIVMAWMNRAARRLPRGPYVSVGRLGGWYPVKYYRSCDYLIGNSPGIHTHILEQGWPARRAVMISNFGELAPAPAADRRSLGVPDDAFLVMGLGRLDHSKGFDVLISAMEQLPVQAHLCIAGDGPVARDLAAQVEACGLKDRVHLLGWRTDQAALLKAADLCAFPSRQEPLGNVILEAWSLGVPVVSTRCEGPSWLVEDGINGLMATPGNAAELAAGIQRLIDDPALRARLGRAGHDKWQGGFSKAQICGQYLNFFEQALAARR